MYGDDHDIVMPTIGTVFDAIAKHPDDENTTDVEKKAVHYFFHTVVATVDSKVTKEEWMTNKTVMHVLGKSWAPHMALAAILMSRASDLNNILKNQKKDDNDGKTSKKKVFDDKDKKALYREHKGYLDKFNEWYNQSLVDQTVHDRFAAWDKETKMTREPKESAAEKRAKNGPPDKRRALEDDQSDDDIVGRKAAGKATIDGIVTDHVLEVAAKSSTDICMHIHNELHQKILLRQIGALKLLKEDIACPILCVEGQ